jgi:hypothetical protein
MANKKARQLLLSGQSAMIQIAALAVFIGMCCKFRARKLIVKSAQ